VKDYGATGNGTTDDSDAIRAAIDASEAAGGGTVYFPNGTYIVSEFETATAYCLTLPNNTTLLGQSKEAAIIKLQAGAGSSVRPILIRTNDCRIANLSIDGNKANQSVDEHRAGIFLWSSNRTVIEDVIIYGNTGDAVDMFITTYTVMQRAYCHDNDRKAISLDGGPNEFMIVRDCWFEDNIAQLHIESEGTVSYLLFEDTYCGPAQQDGFPVSIGAFGQHCYLRGLTILGPLNITSVSDVRVSDCYIETSDPAGPCPLTIEFNTFDVVISDCTFYQTVDQGEEDRIVTIQADSSQFPTQPSNIILRNNTLMTNYGLAQGIVILNCTDVQLIGNRITMNVANSKPAIVVDVTDADQPPPTAGDIILDGNYIENWGTAVVVGGLPGLTIASLTINNNFIKAGTNTPAAGYDLGDSGYTGLLQCAMSGNDHRGLSTVFATYPACPILTGGTRGQGGIYSVATDPNNTVTEFVGAQAVTRDTGQLFMKTSGAGTNTGWSALA